MKRTVFHRLTALLLILSCILSIPAAGAASANRKGYLIVTYNVSVFSDTGLSRRIGSVYPSDEVKVNTVTDHWTHISYLITGTNRWKSGYIPTSTLLTQTTGTTRTSRGNITAYVRPGGAKYGSVYPNDTVLILGIRDGCVQIKYQAGVSFKYAWITEQDARTYLFDQPQNTQSGLHSPVPEGAKFSRRTSDNGVLIYHDINQSVTSNTPVYAITDGTAYFYQYNTNGRLRSYGNYVKFVSADGVYEVRYAHLSRFHNMATPITQDSSYPCSGAASKTLVGQRTVSAGEVLAYIGTTGNSSGLHLHIETYVNGVRVDPTNLFPQLK